MKPAPHSKRNYEDTKLLVVKNGGKKIMHSTAGHLGDFLENGDLLVINRSGTLPSSFSGETERTGEFIEIRLATFLGNDLSEFRRWKAVSFGQGSWRQPTERRGPAPKLQVGDKILLGKDLTAVVRVVDPKFNRLIEIEFQSQHLVQALYQIGKPIQYSYLKEELQIWDQQTAFSGPPISVEPPSAAFPLNWKLLFELQKKGIGIASILHGAGLSSTGDPELDRRLPLEEYYQVPKETIEAIKRAKAQGRRVIALGTTVTRALETVFQNPSKVSLQGQTKLRLGPASKLKIVDGMITGMHEIGTSHAEMMLAFGPSHSKMLQEIEKQTQDYRSHEYGDLALLIRSKDSEQIHFLKWLF